MKQTKMGFVVVIANAVVVDAVKYFIFGFMHFYVLLLLVLK